MQNRYYQGGFYPKRRGLWLEAEFPRFDGSTSYTPPLKFKALTIHRLMDKVFAYYESQGIRSISLSENYGSYPNVSTRKTWLSGPAWYPEHVLRRKETT